VAKVQKTAPEMNKMADYRHPFFSAVSFSKVSIALRLQEQKSNTNGVRAVRTEASEEGGAYAR